jgi:hypothetical protein
VKIDGGNAVAGSWSAIVTSGLKEGVRHFLGQFWGALENHSEVVFCHCIGPSMMITASSW